jgi:hypothetical protein
MQHNRQDDFHKGLNNSHPSEPMNYRYNPLIDRRIKDCQKSQTSDAAVRYSEKHAELGEVYIMLGLLRGFRVRAKIGLSRNHKRRLAYLKDDFGRFIFPVFVISTNNMIRLEQAAHCRFKLYNEHEDRGSGRTEWFRINPIRLLKMIWFLCAKEKQFVCGDRIESFKNNLPFRRNRL